METFLAFLSKIIGIMLMPGKFLFLILLAGSILLFTRHKNLGSWLVALVTGLILIINIFPISNLIIIPLEERFSQRPLPVEIDGIIVLGGAGDGRISVGRGQPAVDASAERLFAFIYLARKYPKAKLIFTGGSGSLTSKYKHFDAARKMFEQSMLDVNRVISESQSRNTYENAVYSYNLIKPKKKETWVLITSASHMPRAVGVFRKINWEVIPYPVDYQTAGPQDFKLRYEGFQNLDQMEIALHEWLGLFSYWATDKTNQLFPGPLH